MFTRSRITRNHSAQPPRQQTRRKHSTMSSAAGLSRRRVPNPGSLPGSSTPNTSNGGGGSEGEGDDDSFHHRKRSSIPGTPRGATDPSGGPSTRVFHAGSAFEGGNKIAYDPRDLQDEAGEERRAGGKMPKLTLMEEVLLLGLKDKQVGGNFNLCG